MIAGLLIFFPQAGALAHKTNLSTSVIAATGPGINWRVSVSAHDLAVALGIETDLTKPVPREAFETRSEALKSYFGGRLGVTSDEQACAAGPALADYDELPETVSVRVGFDCPSSGDFLTFSYRLFFDLDASHRAVGRLDIAQGSEEFLFDRATTDLEIEKTGLVQATHWTDTALRFAWLGAEHIAIGYDHILFLFALLIAGNRFWNLVKVVTAFTLAHSLTLSLAWFQLLQIPSRLVESLIALSIIYVAVENLALRRLTHRWIVALAFGLVHGLGFYSVLSETDLPSSGLVLPLVAFNLGVEAGQITILALLFGLVAWAFIKPWYGTAMRAVSGVIIVIAGVWLVQRALIG